MNLSRTIQNEFLLLFKDFAVNYFISNGAPPEKIILGISSYGKSFQWNSDARMIGGPAKFGDWVSFKQVRILSHAFANQD